MSTPAPSTHVFLTELGWMALAWNEEALSRLTFGHPSAAAAIASLDASGEWILPRADQLPKWVANLADRLSSYAAGNDERFDDVPLDLAHLTDFQRKVVAQCRRIRRGRTRTYGELAAALGTPRAARAVGSVMASNRFPIIIPCHRVVGSAGSLGGFSAEGGLGTKRRMLALEGVSSDATVKGRKASAKRRALTSVVAR